MDMWCSVESLVYDPLPVKACSCGKTTKRTLPKRQPAHSRSHITSNVGQRQQLPTNQPSTWQNLHAGTGNSRNQTAPPRTGSLALRAREEWRRHAVATALDRPLAVSDPQKLIEIILKIIRDGFYALFFLQKKCYYCTERLCQWRRFWFAMALA